MALPMFGVAYTFNINLLDRANVGDFKLTPTIVAGDFQISKDNAALTNIATLPTEVPAGSGIVMVTLTPSEMSCTKLSIRAIDIAGNEWTNGHWFIDIPSVNVETLSAHFPEGLRRSTVFNNFRFTMLSTATPPQFLPGVTVTAQRSRDAEVGFVACDNPVVEVGSGAYRINLSATDTNAAMMTLLFTAPGALAKMLTIKTGP